MADSFIFYKFSINLLVSYIILNF